MMKKVLISAFALCLVLGAVAQESLADLLNDGGEGCVMICANRGDWRNAPENSLAALQRSIEAGVEIASVGIQRTKDGVVILMNDQTVDRTTSSRGTVARMDYDQIRKLQLRNGIRRVTPHRVPTLEQAMLLCKDKILLQIENWYDCLPEILEMGRHHGCLNQLVFRGAKDSRAVKTLFGDDLMEVNYIPVVVCRDRAQDSIALKDYTDNLPSTVIGFSFDSGHMDALPTVPSLASRGYRIWLSAQRSDLCAGHGDESAENDIKNSYGWLLACGGNVITTDRAYLWNYFLENITKRNEP